MLSTRRTICIVARKFQPSPSPTPEVTGGFPSFLSSSSSNKACKYYLIKEPICRMEPWMVAAAKEELRLLEAQHPDRFDYLKLDLKSLIADAHSAPSFSPASTQASTSNTKRKVKGSEDDVGGGGSSREKRRRRSEDGGGSKSRVDMAIERAEACLRRIQQVKESFFC